MIINKKPRTVWVHFNRINVQRNDPDIKKPPKSKFADRDKLLKEKYGISIAQYNKMFKLVNGKCPICGTKLYNYHEKNGRRASPVDHDHKTGRVRSVICYSCNRFRVGRNTAETAAKLVEYLSSSFDGRDL